MPTPSPRRTALVTGASRGIGRAIAERIAVTGTVIAVHYGNDATAAGEVVAEIEYHGGTAFSLQADLASTTGPDDLVSSLETALSQSLGDTGLDILVNNAGIGCPGGIDEVTPEAFDRAYMVNVRAPVFLVQRLLPLLRDGGRIVNISSLASRSAHPRILGYAMGKGAVDVFGRTLAAALAGRRITVNTVAPGLIDTQFHGDRFRADPVATREAIEATPFRRLGHPADVADVVAFLTSEQAGWITGERIETAGGTRL